MTGGRNAACFCFSADPAIHFHHNFQGLHIFQHSILGITGDKIVDIFGITFFRSA